MSRNKEIRRILAAREAAAIQNAEQRRRAKVASLDPEVLYCKNACWPTALRTDKPE